MLIAFLQTSDVMKGRLVIQSSRRKWKKKESRFYRESRYCQVWLYKNHLKQMILLFYLGGFICIALMEIN